MIIQEELDKFVNEFEDEDPALVNQALEECIKIHGRSMWNTSSSALQVNSVWFWIAGWKKRDGALFTIEKDGWGGKWEAGKEINLQMKDGQFIQENIFITLFKRLQRWIVSVYGR